MIEAKIYDVVIMGGGLAGLCLARQLQLAEPAMHIAIIDRRSYPVDESAFKVGESTVEVGANYLGERLQLKTYLKEQHLPKFGLRFFFSQGDNSDITQRLESGATALPPLPSYQIDRGRFENDLRDMVIAKGATFLEDTIVEKVVFSESVHEIIVKHAELGDRIFGRWVIDASGRAGLLKRQLKLEKPCKHKINASWFRVDSEINVADWVEGNSELKWSKKLPPHMRHLSTNHLMGHGYWVWLIPLSSKTTSVGIVADDAIHHHQTLYSFKTVLQWLEKYEPQLASVIHQHKEDRLDFHTLKHFSHQIEQVYNSQERWAITGEAGAFLDPFYSPGTDFIAISNDFICDFIIKDFRGEKITQTVFRHNFLYLAMVESFFNVYQDQYSIMGNAPVMMTKIVWDYAAYWGVTAALYFSNKLCDTHFMAKIMPKLIGFSELNRKTQAALHHWVKAIKSQVEPQFIDTIGEPILMRMLKTLEQMNQLTDDAKIMNIIDENLRLLNAFSTEIISQANGSDENQRPPIGGVLPQLWAEALT
jgi:flavin-dependent dehydrogenase